MHNILITILANEKINFFCSGMLTDSLVSFRFSEQINNYCGSSSVDRAMPCQGIGRGFESRLPLQIPSQVFWTPAPQNEHIDNTGNSPGRDKRI